ncbi:MAG: 3-deoxy-7-phosphoheptulonate synthase [bacterium]|nr:3-deoxy-7-phosphoheptulonate synthase [bacterium]MBK8129808.1 3-deoxy-7-phosphoheptulonate synthase [bacterium]
MLIIMNREATSAQIRGVVELIESLGLRAHAIPGESRTAIGVTGNSGPLSPALFEELPGVVQAVRVTKSFKLVSRETKPDDTVVQIGNVRVGGRELTVMAGPCSVESREQIFKSAELAKQAGAQMLRGGAFKPRTSPYAFRGLGKQALEWIQAAGREFGLPVVSEVVDLESCGMALPHIDMLQVGARNMQNYTLLEAVARSGKPILLKRGPAASLDELLNAAEYILSVGNYNLVLCERGIRGFSDFARNTLDLNIVPAVKEMSHLPIIVDPSHGTGHRKMVAPLGRAAVAVGADGLMVEMHPDPDHALSDGYQSLYPLQLSGLMDSLRLIAPAVGRHLAPA